MKQTAVDYIKEKLMCNEYWYENMTFDQIIEQAKEMEKEQIMDAYNDGAKLALISQSNLALQKGKLPNPEQYYNETFKSEYNEHNIWNTKRAY